MEKVLVNSDKYNGQYVAMVSVEDNTIVGSGNTPEEALKDARKKGIQNPFLLYVPDKDLVYKACVRYATDIVRSEEVHLEKV